MSLPPVLVDNEDVAVDSPFFLRRIIRGADLGAEAADGSASVVMMATVAAFYYIFCGWSVVGGESSDVIAIR